MDLSITIASYNSCQVTRQALQSIRDKTSGLDYEVIVVDNASTDGSSAMIVKEFPWVRLIQSDRNLGFAAAQNRALAAAKGEFLLVLNSDVLFVNNSAGQLVSRLRHASPDVGIVGPQILQRDGSLAPSSRRRIIYSRWLVAMSIVNQLIPFGRLLPMNFARRHCGKLLGRLHDNFNPPAEMQEVEWVDGMCVMFRRELLKQTGLFDEQYFFDMEIGDLLIRCRSLGWHIVFDPGIQVIHLGGYSRRNHSRIMIESYRSNLIYYSKHKPGYVAMIRRLQSALLGTKILFLKAFAFHANKETIEILSETRRMILDYRRDSATRNIRIPRLDSSGLDRD